MSQIERNNDTTADVTDRKFSMRDQNNNTYYCRWLHLLASCDANPVAIYSDHAVMEMLCNLFVFWRCLIVATGIWKPNEPQFEGHEFTEGYDEISTDPNDYEGQNVLILGESCCDVTPSNGVTSPL